MPADLKHEVERAIIITKIESWIKQGLSDNKKIIVIGDLNADPDKLEILKKDYPKRKVKDKYKIISMLNNNRIFDSQIGINEKKKTWIGPLINGKQAESRIDQIWISADLLHERKNTNTIFDDVFKTDHALVTLELDSKNLIFEENSHINKRSIIRREVFDYDKMNKDDWTEYREFIENQIIKNKIKEKYLDQERDECWINSLWEKITL